MKRKKIGRRKTRVQLLIGCHRRCQGRGDQQAHLPRGSAMLGVWSPRPGAGRRGRLGRDTGFTALCQAWGGRRPLRGWLYLEISKRAKRGTRWMSRRSCLCRGWIWERRGLPASPLPAQATPLGPGGPGGLGGGFLRQEGHRPLRTPTCCGCSHPRRLSGPCRLARTCFQCFLDSGAYLGRRC